LPTVTDFPLYEALKAMAKKGGRVASVATCISMDFCYAAPESLLTFVDNHDTPRIALVTGSDVRRMRLALTILLTTRGIPQLLYGTEVPLVGGYDDGSLRMEMPGGFLGDVDNKFSDRGRTPSEREWFSFVRNLLHLRSSHESLSRGALVHFPPDDELYVYFRIGEDSKFMVAVNNGDRQKTLRLERYRRYVPSTATLVQISGDETTTHRGDEAIEIDGLTSVVFEVIQGEK
jgi:glycosidase